jgi:hypothetical protein
MRWHIVRGSAGATRQRFTDGRIEVQTQRSCHSCWQCDLRYSRCNTQTSVPREICAVSFMNAGHIANYW